MNPQSDLRISYDILTLVFNQLASEPSDGSLSACSQTCQMLLHPCRVHLFSAIGIRESNALKFVALLKDNPTIQKYIQELDYVTYFPPFTSEDLANTFLLLNNVKTLNCSGNDDFGVVLPPHTQHAFAHLLSCPSMRSFSICNILDFPAALLSSCSTLKHLAVIGCEISLEACSTSFSAPPQLLSLDLSDNNLGKPMKHLIEMKGASGLPMLDFSHLRSLILAVEGNQQETNLENILRLTPELDYLEISGPYNHYAFFNTLIAKDVLLVIHLTDPDSWTQKLMLVLPTLRSLILIWDVFINITFHELMKILQALVHQLNAINEPHPHPAYNLII